VCWPQRSKGNESIPDEDFLDSVCRRSANWTGLILRYRGWRNDPSQSNYFMLDGPLDWRNNPTGWRKFVEAVEAEMHLSGDSHHIFVEGFEKDGMWLDIIAGS
jgi:hypothetical protein